MLHYSELMPYKFVGAAIFFLVELLLRFLIFCCQILHFFQIDALFTSSYRLNLLSKDEQEECFK